MKSMQMIKKFEKMLEKKLISVSSGKEVTDYRYFGAGPVWGNDLNPVFDWCITHNIRPFWQIYHCIQFFDSNEELIVRLSAPSPNGFVDLFFIVPLEFAEKALVLNEILD